MNAWQAMFAAVFGALTVAPVASRLLASTVTEEPPPGPTAEEQWEQWCAWHRGRVAHLEAAAAAGEDVTRPASRPASTVELGSVGHALVAAADAVSARAAIGAGTSSAAGIPTTTRSARDGAWMPTDRDVAEARSQLAYNQHTAACTGDHDIIRTYGEPGFQWTCNPFVAHRRDPGEYAELMEATRRLHREVRDIEHNHQRLKRIMPTPPSITLGDLDTIRG